MNTQSAQSGINYQHYELPDGEYFLVLSQTSITCWQIDRWKFYGEKPVGNMVLHGYSEELAQAMFRMVAEEM